MGSSNCNIVDVVLIFFLVIRCFMLMPKDLRFQPFLNQLSPMPFTFVTHQLAKTPNSNTINIYLMSGIQNNVDYTDMLGSQAILITAMMHPREETAYYFVKELMRKVVKLYRDNDEQIKYVLSRVVIIFMPVVNIDGVKQSLGLSPEQTIDMRKNMNFVGFPQCKKWTDKGVDINRNFGYKFATVQTSRDPCSQQYHGKNPFSQPESKAIQTLFENFKIVMNLDIHSYGNIWIYPYASDENPRKIQESALFPQYTYLFNKFKQSDIAYDNCFNSLKYTADGVYIDWALEKGSLSFAIQFGDNFTIIGKQMDKQIGAAIQAIKISGMAFQYFLKNQQKQKNTDIKLCVNSSSILQHNAVLLINKQIIQGKRLHPSQTVCFNYNFQLVLKSLNNLKSSYVLPDISVKIGHSNLQTKINVKQLKQAHLKQLDIQPQSMLMKIIEDFKILFITVGVLCFIGSMCGLSIFFQNSLSNRVNDQQLANLRDFSHSNSSLKRTNKIINMLKGVEEKSSNQMIQLENDQSSKNGFDKLEMQEDEGIEEEKQEQKL